MRIKNEFMYIFNAFMNYASFFGSFFFIVFVFLFLYSVNQEDFGLKVMITSVVFLIIEYSVKNFTKETRPDFKTNKSNSFIGKFEERHSFPSGHSAYVALLTTMLNLEYHNILLTSLFAAITISVGFSRIYMKRHFFRDVIGGYVIGITLGVLAFVLFP